MKQGILITAYKNFDHLIDIIRFFDDHFEIYIHIDKKCTPPAETLQRIRTLKNVKFVSSAYKVNWGGLNHLKSILLLAEEALKNPELSYIHLISGQDFPSKDVSYFKDFMHKSRRNDFLEYATMPAPFWSRGGMDRLEQYNFYDVFDARKYGKWIVKLITLQRMLKIKRPISSIVRRLHLVEFNQANAAIRLDLHKSKQIPAPSFKTYFLRRRNIFSNGHHELSACR